MDISFKGYQNVGGYSSVDVTKEGEKIFSHKLIMQLNNMGNRDLDTFEPILKKYSDKVKNNFLVVEVRRTLDLKTGRTKKSYYINKQQIHVVDENLGIFSKIAKLVKRISDDNAEFEIENDYKKSADFKILAAPEGYISEDSLNIMSDVFHNRNNTKEAAANICGSIGKTMHKYMNLVKY